MKKILLTILGVTGIGLVGLLTAAAMQPDTVHVERQVTVAATAADVAAFAGDLKKVNEWSPWDEKDPNVKREYSSKTTGVGAWYAWEGNEDVGRGKQTIKSEEPGKVVHTLEFFEPFESIAESTIAYREQGGETTVTWGFDQTPNFVFKLVLVFRDMDAALGPEFEKGLNLLKPKVEKAAADRLAAANKKQAEAAAAAAAAKAAAALEVAAAGDEPAPADKPN
ncbi:MAG: SRPBCC family protein [Myxococcales bacterium FL481]|nr:MAG: SRPBCC family protein [Myxococcales bacterium FL481]